MALIGGLIVGLSHAFGHSYIDGVGYGVIQSILNTQTTDAGLLLLLLALKMLATTVSLGSGASAESFLLPSISARRWARSPHSSPSRSQRLA